MGIFLVPKFHLGMPSSTLRVEQSINTDGFLVPKFHLGMPSSTLRVEQSINTDGLVNRLGLSLTQCSSFFSRNAERCVKAFPNGVWERGKYQINWFVFGWYLAFAFDKLNINQLVTIFPRFPIFWKNRISQWCLEIRFFGKIRFL